MCVCVFVCGVCGGGGGCVCADTNMTGRNSRFDLCFNVPAGSMVAADLSPIHSGKCWGDHYATNKDQQQPLILATNNQSPCWRFSVHETASVSENNSFCVREQRERTTASVSENNVREQQLLCQRTTASVSENNSFCVGEQRERTTASVSENNVREQQLLCQRTTASVSENNSFCVREQQFLCQRTTASL